LARDHSFAFVPNLTDRVGPQEKVRLHMIRRAAFFAASLALLGCPQNELPKRLDSNFSMAEHSMPFANFASGYENSEMTPELLQRMFGTAVCATNESPCELKQSARAFMKRANRSMGGGRCEGFAVLASLFEAGKLNPADFGADSARELALQDNTKLQRELAYWFSTQLVSDASLKNTKQYMAKDIMPVLAEMFKAGATERWRLGIVRKKGSVISGGHAMTPMGYYSDDTTKGVYWLRVYDNNNPDSERLIKIDTIKNRWEFEASENPTAKSRLYFGDASNKNPIYLAPVLTRTGTLPCTFCDSNDTAQVVTSGGAQVSTQSGSGVADGELDANTTPSFTSPLDDEPARFISNIGLDGLLNLNVTAPYDPDYANETQAVEVATRHFTVNVDELTVTAADQLKIADNGAAVRYVNQSHTSLSLRTEVTLLDGGALAVAAVIRGGSTEVSASIDPNTGKVSVGASNAEGAQVTMVVTRTDGTGEETSAQLSFVASGDGGITADTSTWSDSNPLEGTINDNGVETPVTDACGDGKRSGMETDVDCGSVCASKCLIGLNCNVGADCESTFCHATTKVCVASSCEDGRVSGNESDVDCGGAACGSCANGKACVGDGDCTSTAACASNVCVPTYVVGVSVSGVPVGDLVVLQNNGADNLSASGSGSFLFSKRVRGAYAVTILTQPSTATCTVTRGTGTASANVSDVVVACSPTYALGGTLSGLPGSDSVVLKNGSELITLTSNGTFQFTTRVASAYAVTVDTQPAGASCVVTAGSGTAATDVSDVQVTCTTAYALGGTLSGLPALDSVILMNGSELLTVSTNGSFQFSTRVASTYAVTVATQPAGATCVVTNGSGTATADVTNVTVVCAGGFTIAGMVFGLPFTEQVTLQNNGADDQTVFIDGPFAFSQRATGYSVTVKTQPAGVRCTVTNGSGTASADVSDVTVNCMPSGVLDVSFNGVGWRAIPHGTGSDYWIRGVMNPDDSMVLVGPTQNGADTDWVVSKLLANGDLDPSFGTFGHTVISNGAGVEYPRSIFRDGAGRYVVIGGLRGATDTDLGIVRLTATGTLDATFGTAGVAIHNAGQWEYFEEAVEDAAGGYIVVGRQSLTGAGPHDVVIGRLTNTGALDTSFGTLGWVTVDTGADESGNSVSIDSATQDILVVAAANNDTLVMRFNLSGVPVAGFGTAGIVTLDISGTSQPEFVYRLLTDGANMMVVGRADGAVDSDIAIIRLTAAGALDTSFGSSGRLLIDRGGNDVGYAITPAPGGGWYVGGHAGNDMLVTKLSATGVIDTSFGASGFFQDPIVNSALAYNLMLDSRGFIVAVGTIRFTGTEDLGVVRLTP